MADHALAEIFQWNTPFEANIENIKSRDRWIDVRNYRKKCSHDNRGDDAAKITYELWLVERQNMQVKLATISQETGIVTITSHFGGRSFTAFREGMHNHHKFFVDLLVGFYDRSLQSSAAGNQ